MGSRLWLYTNFDCNLRCDYCCVRSSPTAPRRELGLARVQRIAREAAELGVKEIFVTGGEPFLLEDIGEILFACAAAAPTTVLTNGMLFTGRRVRKLASVASRSNCPANQSGQRHAGAARSPSRTRNMGANTRRYSARSCAGVSRATGSDCFD